MAYSIDFREKVILIYKKKRSLRKTAELLEVSYNFVKDIVKRWKTEGTLEPRPHGGGNPPKIKDIHVPFLKEMIENQNDLTLEEMCLLFQQKFNIKVSTSTMCDSLKRLDLTRKKNFSRSKNRRARK
jgi:transposase